MHEQNSNFVKNLIFLNKEKLIIGRVDIADFPLLEIYDIAIKIDSGAYTSSIHCKNIKEINGELHCEFLDDSHTQYDGKKFTFTDYNTTTVKSSNGIASERFAIKTQIRLFDKVYPITLTLNDREEMRFPVLIGRKFLSGKFLIDPKLTDLSFSHKKSS